jgi:hypothetical protein
VILVKQIGLGALSLIAAAALAGSPALAAKHATHHSTVSCKQIKEAVDSGKSADEVAKDLKVSASRVKSCTAPAAKHGKKSTAHPS